jgi:hypothetical protein
MRAASLLIRLQSIPRLVRWACSVELGAWAGRLPHRNWLWETSRRLMPARRAGTLPVRALPLRDMSMSFESFPQLGGTLPEVCSQVLGSKQLLRHGLQEQGV